jgi:hypothetical protein
MICVLLPLLLLLLLLLLQPLPPLQASAAGHSDQQQRLELAGWEPASAELAGRIAALERPCTIRSSSSDLSGLAQEASEPTLVRVPAAEWPAGVRAWQNRDSFLRRHGAVSVEPHSSLATAQGGARRTATARGRSLSSVLAQWRHGEPDSQRQVFEAAASTLLSEQLQDGTVGEACGSNGSSSSSSWVDAMREELGEELRSRMGSSEAELLLSIGQSGAGLPRHSHGAAWLASIVGSKFWVLHPPTAEGGAPEFASLPFSAGMWLKRLADLGAPGAHWDGDGGAPSQQRVEWCVQRPGEVMVLPPFWHHATINIGETIAVGGQRCVAS